MGFTNKIHLGCWACVVDENEIMWFSSYDFNGLFSYDIANDEINCVGCFDTPKLAVGELHYSAFLNENEVIFMPLYDCCIRIYDRKKGVFSSVPIPNHECGNGYRMASKVQDSIWFFSDCGVLYSYNILRKTIGRVDNKKIRDIEDYILKNNESIRITPYSKGFVINDSNTNDVALFDVESYKLEKIRIDDRVRAKGYAYYDSESLWFLFYGSTRIARYSILTRKYKEYHPDPETWIENKRHEPYSPICFWKDKVVVPNYYAGNILVIDKHTDSIEYVSMPEGFMLLGNRSFGAAYSSTINLNERVLLVPERGNMLLILDQEGCVLEKRIMDIEFDRIGHFDRIIQDYGTNTNILCEGNGMGSIDAFISGI